LMAVAPRRARPPWLACRSHGLRFLHQMIPWLPVVLGVIGALGIGYLVGRRAGADRVKHSGGSWRFSCWMTARRNP
jgi:hypothetical protein